jgi:hypothetical protein
MLLSASAYSNVIQVDVSHYPNGTPVPANHAISNEWRDVGILFAARRQNEPVGQQGTIQPIVGGNGVECARYFFFQPDVTGAVGIFRFVVPGTNAAVDISHFEMVAGWNAGESITVVGFNAAGSSVAQQTFGAPPGCTGFCNGMISLTGQFRSVEVRTQGNPGIGFPNCGLQGGYGLRFTPVACDADVTGDNQVDVDDLIAVILGWGACPAPPAPCAPDIDHSGAIDVDDLIAVILGWGSCP